MDRVVRFYGFEVNRSGFLRCPFHQEKTASCKLYDKNFVCFGCGKKGSVIDFVMALYDITFQQAVLRLNADFCLGLSGDLPSPLARSKLLAERRREAQERKRAEDAYTAMTNRYRDLWEAKKAGYEHPLYAEACKNLDYLDDWLETHQPGR
ncbi:MAG: CHC2 zinc finger domain-containing protein [Oscillospiraceae bacterium]